MAQPVIQTSFNAGEWAPALYSRVDLTKYHSGAALIENFFVDYRGGATTSPGTKFIQRTDTNFTTRLIPFQASFSVSYILEFGQGYIRFYQNGSPIVEDATSITVATAGPPEVFTDTAHGYTNGEWIFVENAYYIVQGTTTNTFTLTDLFGAAINSNPFTLPAAAQRVYTLTTSPYQPADLALIKFVQNVSQLILCHPNYPPYVLTLISATNWTMAPITFGSTIPATVSVAVTTTLAGGSVDYSYAVTSVDINGQESEPTFGTISGAQDIRSVVGTNTITWTAVTGAVSYNVYRAEPRYSATVPVGAPHGFIGNATGTSIIDSNITPDFSQAPPVAQDPFSGTGVATISLTSGGTGWTSVPLVTLTAAPGGGVTATATCGVNLLSASIDTAGNNYLVGDYITLQIGVLLQVTSISVGAITGFHIVNAGFLSSGFPPNILTQISSTGFGTGARFNPVWEVAGLTLLSAGDGYLSAPSVTFTGLGGSGATATTTLGAASAGNPTVPGFQNERLFLGGQVGSPQSFNESQPGSYFNFDTTNPTQPDDAFTQTLVSGILNTIKAAVPMPTGLIVLSDRQAWLINGGSPGTPVSATSVSATAQAYNGCADLPPIVANDNILYVQAKGSIVRDLVFNYYTQVYTGTDISVLSSHLFYGFQLLEWAWAEEPFKLVWAVRNDGVMLTLTFLKEQELIAWAHRTTQGLYKSVATVTETTESGVVDAIYSIVQRTINGQVVQYIERNVELSYPQGYKSSWQVDAGIGYSGIPATTFSGAQHLASAVVTGVADGTVINFTMPGNGVFVFGPGGTPGLTGIASASIVTVGLAIPTPTVTTLPLDLGQPTVQGKRKKVTGLAMKVWNALGLWAGTTTATTVQLADTTLGNVGTMSNELVTDLVTGDVRLVTDPDWNVYGQYSITQPNPYPATILGVIPEIEVGDDE
jgi:hypothetical protein